jgi:hypothetical protein
MFRDENTTAPNCIPTNSKTASVREKHPVSAAFMRFVFVSERPASYRIFDGDNTTASIPPTVIFFFLPFKSFYLCISVWFLHFTN